MRRHGPRRPTTDENFVLIQCIRRARKAPRTGALNFPAHSRSYRCVVTSNAWIRSTKRCPVDQVLAVFPLNKTEHLLVPRKHAAFASSAAMCRPIDGVRPLARGRMACNGTGPGNGNRTETLLGAVCAAGGAHLHIAALPQMTCVMRLGRPRSRQNLFRLCAPLLPVVQ